MKDGDIDNVAAPRVMVVFEGLVASVPDELRPRYSRYKQLHFYQRAAQCYQFDRRNTSVVSDWMWRLQESVTMVTFEDLPVVRRLSDRLDTMHFPAPLEFFPSPAVLARELAYMPNVHTIHFADPAMFMYFGGRRGKLGI